jgi:hypothetical protein
VIVENEKYRSMVTQENQKIKKNCFAFEDDYSKDNEEGDYKTYTRYD